MEILICKMLLHHEKRHYLPKNRGKGHIFRKNAVYLHVKSPCELLRGIQY